MISILGAFITSFIISYFAIPKILVIAHSKEIVDVADGKRKFHEGSVPQLGGVAVFGSILFSLCFWADQSQIIELQYIISALIVIFFLGFVDDLEGVGAGKKIIGQLLVAVVLTHYSGVRLNNMFGLFGFHEIPIALSYILTIFTIIVIINAFNLVDGINWLAALMGILTCLSFGIWFYLMNMHQYVILCISLIASLLAFMAYNRTPARIFLGDTGSMLVGVVAAITSVKFIETVRSLPLDHPFKIESAPVFAIAVVFIPLFDTLRVFAIRLYNKKSPFHADNNHLHHLLLALNFGHIKSSVILFIFNALIIGLVLATQSFRGEVVLVCILGLGIVFSLIASKKSRWMNYEKLNSN